MILTVDVETLFGLRIQGSQLYYVEREDGFVIYLPKADGIILKAEKFIPSVIDEETGAPNFEQKLFFASEKLTGAIRVLSVQEFGRVELVVKQ